MNKFTPKLRPAQMLLSIVAGVLAVQSAQASTYTFRQFSKDIRVSVAAAEPTPPLQPAAATVGDGISHAGACVTARADCSVLRSEDLTANVTMSADGLSVSGLDGWGSTLRASSIGISSGKWYFEGTFVAFNPYSYSNGVGFVPATASQGTSLASMGGISLNLATPADGFMEIVDRNPNNRFLWVNPAYPAPGQVVGVALDMDNLQVTFYSPLGIKGPFPVPAGTWVPAVQDRTGAMRMNFGQQDFYYAVPAGFNTGVW